MRAEAALLLALGAGPALAAGAEEALPSAAFLEFLGALVEVEGELLGPQDLEALPELEDEAEGAVQAADAERMEEGEP